MSKKTTDQAIDYSDERGWEDTTNRFPTDALLRRNGFKIHGRRKSDEPVWVKGGHLYAQSSAVEQVACDPLNAGKI